MSTPAISDASFAENLDHESPARVNPGRRYEPYRMPNPPKAASGYIPGVASGSGGAPGRQYHDIEKMYENLDVVNKLQAGVGATVPSDLAAAASGGRTSSSPMRVEVRPLLTMQNPTPTIHDIHTRQSSPVAVDPEGGQERVVIPANAESAGMDMSAIVASLREKEAALSHSETSLERQQAEWLKHESTQEQLMRQQFEQMVQERDEEQALRQDKMDKRNNELVEQNRKLMEQLAAQHNMLESAMAANSASANLMAALEGKLAEQSIEAERRSQQQEELMLQKLENIQRAADEQAEANEKIAQKSEMLQHDVQQLQVSAYPDRADDDGGDDSEVASQSQGTSAETMSVQGSATINNPRENDLRGVPMAGQDIVTFTTSLISAPPQVRQLSIGTRIFSHLQQNNVRRPGRITAEILQKDTMASIDLLRDLERLI